MNPHKNPLNPYKILYFSIENHNFQIFMIRHYSKSTNINLRIHKNPKHISPKNKCES